MKYKFYDTCSLIKAVDHIWDDEDTFLVVSQITLQELESIKTASNKDPDVKYAARRLVHELDQNYSKYQVTFWDRKCEEQLREAMLPPNNDNKIIISVRNFANTLQEYDTLTFFTNDISCKHMARLLLPSSIKVSSFYEEVYDYDGYKEVYLDEEGMNQFYSNQDTNLYNLLVNQYLLIYDKETGECVDRLCWNKDDSGKEGYRRVSFINFNSRWFGDVKPMKGDDYQMLAADSLSHNRITMIKGRAGSGKTYLSLAYLIHKLERHHIDKIIVFCNTVATKNSAKLGLNTGMALV